VASYLVNLEHALDEEVAGMGDGGRVDVFALTRRLGHRMGLASWAGPGAADGDTFEALVRAFDALDGADSFVHPDAMQAVAESDYANERAALAQIVDLLSGVVDQDESQALFARISEAWADEAEAVRRVGVAHDVALIHIASMSNLASALGWAVVDLIANPEALARVRAGDEEFAGRCALESVRLAQRSIMARTVLSPVTFDDGETSYEVGPGTTIATLLPLTNRSPELGHDSWDPERWNRHKFVDTAGLGSTQLVTSFGHGKHSCPAQPFSIAAMTMAMTRLVTTFELAAGWSSYPVPVPAQIGGVARSDKPCPMEYAKLA
ncbi:MAG: cytochrome P450, partial [Aeromicrobium sp.]